MLNSLLLAERGSAFVKGTFDQHLIRASMVIIFLLFGYQKWFAYGSQELIPFIENGPLISWLYPVFGIRGGSFFLGVVEWTICLLLFWGAWNRSAGVLGALGSCATFVTTLTIIPFMPNGWDVVAGGFPAMTGNIPLLIKGVVMLAASFYLLRQDVVAVLRSANRPIRLIFPIKQVSAAMAALGLLRDNLEYYVLRTAMVIIFAAFGYTKWHPYAAYLMVPFISNSPFIFWLYPAFGFRGASRFLGASDWTMFVLLYAGFWDKRFGVLGSLGATGNIHHDCYDHPLHTEWLGPGCRISCNDWRRAVPGRGRGASCSSNIFAETRPYPIIARQPQADLVCSGRYVDGVCTACVNLLSDITS